MRHRRGSPRAPFFCSSTSYKTFLSFILICSLLSEPILMKRDFVEETKSSYRDEDGTRSELHFVCQVDPVRVNLIGSKFFRRFAENGMRTAIPVARRSLGYAVRSSSPAYPSCVVEGVS